MTYLIAHIGGMPVEELLGQFASSAGVLGAGMLVALAAVVARVRRRRNPRGDRH